MSEDGGEDLGGASPGADNMSDTSEETLSFLHRTILQYDVKVPRYDGQDLGKAADRFSFRRFLLFCGPGLVMCQAYIDPGNLEADLQLGARANFALGWLILWSTVLGFVVQLLAVRLGVATRGHLALHCQAVYPIVPRTVIWLMMEAAIIGSDIQEVIGSAIAIQLLSNGAVPLWAGALLTGVGTSLVLLLERNMKQVEAVLGSLVFIMAAAFVSMYFVAECPTGDVLRGTLVPSLRWSQIGLATGIVGALVMPHNIFLHSDIVQHRRLDLSVNPGGAKREAMWYYTLESACSLAITVVINLCVVAVFAVGFYGNTSIADTVGLSSAGQYLGERFGGFMKVVWAIGVLAAGQASTVSGTYTGGVVMAGIMDKKLPRHQRVLLARSLALLPTLFIAITYGGSSVMDSLNQLINVLQSFQLPFALLPVLYVTSRTSIMDADDEGRGFAIQSAFKWFVYAVCACLLMLNITLGGLAAHAAAASGVAAAVLVTAAVAAYGLALLYLVLGPAYVHAVLQRTNAARVRAAFGWLAQADGERIVVDLDGEAVVAPGSASLDTPLLGAEGL